MDADTADEIEDAARSRELALMERIHLLGEFANMIHHTGRLLGQLDYLIEDPDDKDDNFAKKLANSSVREKVDEAHSLLVDAMVGMTKLTQHHVADEEQKEREAIERGETTH